MQISGNIVQKIGNSVQKEVINQAFLLVNEQTKSEIANQMQALDGAIFAWLRDSRAFLLLRIFFFMYMIK